MTTPPDRVHIVEEGEFIAERRFAESWLHYVLPTLSHMLGVNPPGGEIHVVLSPTT